MDHRAEDAEWVSATIVTAVRAVGPHGDRVKMKAGVVKLDDGRLRVAVQVDDRPIVMLPPASTARLIGALREAITASNTSG